MGEVVRVIRELGDLDRAELGALGMERGARGGGAGQNQAKQFGKFHGERESENWESGDLAAADDDGGAGGSDEDERPGGRFRDGGDVVDGQVDGAADAVGDDAHRADRAVEGTLGEVEGEGHGGGNARGEVAEIAGVVPRIAVLVDEDDIETRGGSA